MRIDSIQVGQPQIYAAAEDREPWTSAIAKSPVSGRIWAGSLGLTGDAVADTHHHGGPFQAILFYSAEHYPVWQAEWDRSDLGPGSFGENLTVAGASEDAVCIGDRLQIGEVRLAVTSPRTPCNTLALRLGVPDVIKMVLQNHRCGWYVKVVQEGWIEAGLPVELLERPYPEWTIRRAAEAKLHRLRDREEAALLAECPALHPEWRETLLK
ncbi:MAG: MOSC domain-containing protein [Gemmatimonadota bacterium]|nr:MOSC domain-containing protein [Gemmatimonadota bacterium]